MKTLFAATLTLLVFAAAPAQSGEIVRAWQGGRTIVKAKHLVPAMKDGEGYGEKYTFNADFGDKGDAYFSFTISNLGFGDHKMESKGRITIGDKKFIYKKKLDDDEWSFSKDPLKITAGPATFSGTPKRLVLEAQDGGDAFEMVFTPIANAWRPRDGRIQFGKERKISDFTIFPLMKVEARYKFDGGDWQRIEGTGRGTHSWSELAVYEQARWTMEFRGISGDYTIYFRELSTGGDYERKRIPYLLITKGKRVLIESFDYEFIAKNLWIDVKHPNLYKVVTDFQLVGTDAEEKHRKFRASITKKKLRKRKDMLASMGAAMRMVAKRYSKPVSYDYDVDYLFEVKIGEEIHKISGVGRYEMYHWNR